MDNIIRILQVFHLASGLKINIHKSNVYGIGVSADEVSHIANNTGCTSGSFPFIYLGLPIGANMGLTSNWKILIDRFHSKLSTWKANLLFIAGRLTLIKSVLGSLGIYYLSIFKAPQHKDCLIRDRISNGQWSWHWSRTDLGTRNLAYFRDLLLEISQFDFGLDRGNSAFMCLVFSNDGVFSVGATRRLIGDHLLLLWTLQQHGLNLFLAK
ncbi:hypothetical protein Tco_1506558 [Tanacetum coccineum]